MPALIKQPLAIALAFSLALHAFALFGIGFVLPDPRKAADFLQPLQVVLVNAKSKSRPAKADALAQHNLDGGGNTPEERRAKTPLPALNDGKQFTPEQAARRQQQLEQESKRLLTQIKSTRSVAQENNRQQQQESGRTNGEDLMQRSLEIARLEAEISKDMSAYQKIPRRKFIGARTRSAVEAQYLEDWRIKVERIGNLNYPPEARRDQIYGKLILSVSINADGSLGPVEVDKSSGRRILDAAAQRIVKLAAPYPPIPAEILKEYKDGITITRTWTFTQADKLESE